ncbi:MAG: histidine phosphatase family protein [Arenicellales bacterium]|nr:histidine phosphatase family protein [Arenicellales bacterium]
MTGDQDNWIVFVRHGPTGWNAAGRIQGQRDVPLSDLGRTKVAQWSIPRRYRQAVWVSSPLSRAKQTAALMGCDSPKIESRLMEMDWGEWEGRTLSDLRSELGMDMLQNEQRGLDFKPDGGESPRQVRERLQSWLRNIATEGQPHIAVTHKGVIRAALSLATGWSMTDDPPYRLSWDCAHVFKLYDEGQISVGEVNVPLTEP